MIQNHPEPTTIGIGDMVSASMPSTLFLVAAAVLVRISLLPIDIQLGSVFPLPLLLLAASVWSLSKALTVARESHVGLRNFYNGLLIHLGSSSVLCLAVFLAKV